MLRRRSRCPAPSHFCDVSWAGFRLAARNLAESKGSGFAVKDECGQVQRVVGVAADITERKRAEEALRERTPV